MVEQLDNNRALLGNALYGMLLFNLSMTLYGVSSIISLTL